MHALGCRWWLNNQRELSVSRLWPEFHWQELDRRGTHAVTIGQKSGQGAESEANSNTLRTCPNYANGVKVRGAARTVGAKTNFHLSFPPPVFNTTTRDLSLSFLGSFFMGVIRQFFLGSFFMGVIHQCGWLITLSHCCFRRERYFTHQLVRSAAPHLWIYKPGIVAVPMNLLCT